MSKAVRRETNKASKVVTNFFAEGEKRKGEINDVRAGLHDESESKRKEALQEAICIMGSGKDASSLVLDVLKCGNTTNITVKKLVYMFLMLCGPTADAPLAVQSLASDTTNLNPIVRAMSLRTLGCLSVANKDVTTTYIDCLKACMEDADGYVVKTAVLRLIRFAKTNFSDLESRGLIKTLIDKLNDPKPMVVANALVVLNEIDATKSGWIFKQPALFQVLKALQEAPEWAMVYLLQGISRYVVSDNSDAAKIYDGVSPFLQHSNSAIVMGVVRVVVNIIDHISAKDSALAKLAPPLVSLLSASDEVQYVALRNINLILQTGTPIPFDVKVFFCQYTDPVYVQLEKLEIMITLATPQNMGEVLPELQEYAEKLDSEFVCRAVRAIGRCAIKLDGSADQCVNVLRDLISTADLPVQQEGVIVMKDIYRRYPGRFEESTLSVLCSKASSLEDPESKAALIWVFGEYADRVQKADEMLTKFLSGFAQETVVVQLHLLTAMVKLFLKMPSPETHKLVEQTLDIATKHTDNPDVRDRGYVYWRLLASYQDQARKIVLVNKPVISSQESNLDPSTLALLVSNLSSLASVYHKTPSSFVKSLDVKPLQTFSPSDIKTTNTSDYAGSSAFQTSHNSASYMQTSTTSQTPMSAFDTVTPSAFPIGGFPSANPFGAPASSGALALPFTGGSDSPFATVSTNINPFASAPSGSGSSKNPFDLPPSGSGSTANNDIVFDGSNPFGNPSDLPFVPESTSTPFGDYTPPLPPKQEQLPLLFPLNDDEANGIGKGLQLNGRFLYSGALFLELDITNTTGQTFESDIQLQFNNNTYQLDSPATIPVKTFVSGQPLSIKINCAIGGNSADFPSEVVQVAMKVSEIICLFNMNLPLSTLLTPDAHQDEASFSQLWDIIAHQVAVPVGPIKVPQDQIASVLSAHNVFLVGFREGSLLLSAKVGIDATLILMALSPQNSELLIKTDVPDYVGFMKNVIVGILC